MKINTTANLNLLSNVKSFDLKKFFSKYVIECILLVMFVLLAVFKEGFFTAPNLLNILRNMSLQGVIAFGMTIVIISAEIDLSVGASVGLSGVIIAQMTGLLAKFGIPMEYGVLIGIATAFAVGICIGLLAGYLLTVIDMPSFIITLGLYTLLYGLAGVLCNGFPIISLPDWYSQIGSGYLFGVIPIPAVILLIVFALIFVLMNYTKYGRTVYAVGGNKDSARLSGINVRFVKTAALVIVQVLAVLSGVMVSSQVMAGNYNFGYLWGMTIISACIIGGTSIFGGIGKVWGTLMGLLFIGVVLNGMTLLNVDEFWQNIFRGGITIFAVFVSTLQSRTKT